VLRPVAVIAVVATALPAGADKIASVLVDASGCLQGGVELRLPDEKFASQYELRPASFNQAAHEPAVAKHLEECLGDWCNQVSNCKHRLHWPSSGLDGSCDGVLLAEEQQPAEHRKWLSRLTQLLRSVEDCLQLVMRAIQTAFSA
jgi:hypothetical protein